MKTFTILLLLLFTKIASSQFDSNNDFKIAYQKKIYSQADVNYKFELTPFTINGYTEFSNLYASGKYLFNVSGGVHGGQLLALAINSNSNIGIGTPTPSNKLTVRTSNALEGVRVESSSGKLAYLGNLGSNSNIDRGLLELYDQGNTLIRLAAKSTNDSFINAGNFGIGTTSPSEKLTVDGNILIYHPDDQYHNSPSTLTLLNNAIVFKHGI